jgi:succinate-acetate transporter protein
MSRDTADAHSRMTYDRFVEFERLMGSYPSGAGRPYNPRPIGFCAFALTLFVYAMYLAGATVPIQTSAALAMGLALFYGGLIQLIAGLYELRLGNNFNALYFVLMQAFGLDLAHFMLVVHLDLQHKLQIRPHNLMLLVCFSLDGQYLPYLCLFHLLEQMRL